MFVTRAALPLFPESGGSIVNIQLVHEHDGVPYARHLRLGKGRG